MGGGPVGRGCLSPACLSMPTVAGRPAFSWEAPPTAQGTAEHTHIHATTLKWAHVECLLCARPVGPWTPGPARTSVGQLIIPILHLEKLKLRRDCFLQKGGEKTPFTEPHTGHTCGTLHNHLGSQQPQSKEVEMRTHACCLRGVRPLWRSQEVALAGRPHR